MEQLYCQFRYDGLIREMIHQYKFLKDYCLCELLAYLIEIPQASYDYIAPIPSSPAHDLSRTFSPVEAVLKAKGIRFDKALKMSNRPKQSYLTKRERLTDEDPFIIDTRLDLSGKEMLLVGDIHATGLTVHRAGRKLYAKNIRKFKVFAFAR